MNRYIALLTLVLALAFPATRASADDAGSVAADARTVLAATVRALGSDPRSLQISGVSVSGNRAEFTWSAAGTTRRETMHRLGDRWMLDFHPAAPLSSDALRIKPSGAQIALPAAQMAGYGVTIRYQSSTAPPDSRFSFFYGRTPTPAEFLHYPTVYPLNGSDAVCYFDVTIDAPKPIAFASGSVIDVWFPFVLDGGIGYVIFMDGATKPIGPISSPSVFDNSLHFVLPAFVITPGNMLRFEIDGEPR